MGVFSAARANANHTVAAQKQRQTTDRRQDANASAHPNKTTLAEVKGRQR